MTSRITFFLIALATLFTGLWFLHSSHEPGAPVVLKYDARLAAVLPAADMTDFAFTPGAVEEKVLPAAPPVTDSLPASTAEAGLYSASPIMPAGSLAAAVRAVEAITGRTAPTQPERMNISLEDALNAVRSSRRHHDQSDMSANPFGVVRH